MSIVVPKLPDVKQKCEECPRQCPYCKVFSLPTYLSTLSRRKYAGRSDRTTARMGDPAVGIGIESSFSESDSGEFGNSDQFHDDLAQCPN
jgi:hypothetical protein